MQIQKNIRIIIDIYIYIYTTWRNPMFTESHGNFICLDNFLINYNLYGPKLFKANLFKYKHVFVLNQ